MAEKRVHSKEERKVMNESINNIVNTFEKEMKDQFGLICIGQGGGMPYDVEKLGLRFVRHQQTSIEEARELEIRATERFVELINANEVIRPYLRDPPWNYRRTEVTIAFRNSVGEYYPEGVTFVLQAKDQIFYFGPEKHPNDIDHLKEEPYAEAKTFVENNPSCLKPIEKLKKKTWCKWF